MKKLLLLSLIAGLYAIPAYANNTFPTTGNAGAGTTSPNVQLEVDSTSASGQFRTRYDTGGSGLLINQTSSGGEVNINNQDNSALIFAAHNNEAMRLQPDGKVGVGTTTPAFKLDVQGSAGSTLASNGLPVINKINVVKFTSSGTYTPSTGLEYALVEVVGGGGGGAGTPGTAAGAGSGGGGGGGGAYARAIKTAATIGASQTITVGAGGAAGSSTCCSQNGGSGGSTSVGTLISAGAGNGGVQLNTSCNTVCQTGTPGSGGSPGGTYDYGVPGQTGSYGMAISGWQAAIGGAGGTSGTGSSGGATAMPGSGSGVATTGASPSGYGGGGGGGATSAGGAIGGGAGAPGIVVVTEYISD